MSDPVNPASLEHNIEANLSSDSRNFAHLHQQTQFSLLDGAAQVKDLLKWVAKTSDSNPTLAMTDHGNMHGAVTFYKYAAEFGVKPIIGYEAYVAAGSKVAGDQSKPHDGVQEFGHDNRGQLSFEDSRLCDLEACVSFNPEQLRRRSVLLDEANEICSLRSMPIFSNKMVTV
jgi:PHP domain